MRNRKSQLVGNLKQAAIAALTIFALSSPAQASYRSIWAEMSKQAIASPIGSVVYATVSIANYFGKTGLAEVDFSSLTTSGKQFQLIDPITTSSVAKSFFGTVAVPFSSIAVRSQWTRVRQQSLPTASNCSSQACKNRVAKLNDAAARGKSLNFSAKLSLANATVNSVINYTSDRSAYGKLDYWASSREMVQKGVGDCEDFAILKQTLLRAMGVPDKSLSIIILKDNARNLYHAVLGVSTNQGNLVLDNVRSNVFRDTQVANYQPLFSFSGNRSWIHGTASRSTTVAVQNVSSLNSVAPGESAVVPVLISGVDFNLIADLRPTLRD